MTYDRQLRTVAPQPVMSIRGTTRFEDLSATIGKFMAEVRGHVQSQGGRFAGPPLTRYHGVGHDGIDLGAGLAVAAHAAETGRVKARLLPGGDVVATTHRGHYGGLPLAGEALEEWARLNGRERYELNRESYNVDPGAKPDPVDWETEVVMPLRALNPPG